MAITVTQSSRRYKALIVITAGTPIFAATGLSPLMVNRVIIQALHGGTGLIKVYDDVPIGMSAAQVAAGGDLAIELAPASANAPGGTYSDLGNSIDLRMIAIDGLVNGDSVMLDAYLRN